MVQQTRSWMFVPGDKERFLEKARSSPGDGMLLDLEDGVLPANKEVARRMTAEALQQDWRPGVLRYVRTNAADTGLLEADLAAVLVPGLDGLCISKVESPDVVHEVSAILTDHEREAGREPGSIRLLLAIESAAALIDAPTIARSGSRIIGLVFGTEDYALDLGLGSHRTGEAAELIYARSAIVNAAAAARVLSIDGVFPDLDNPEGLYADAIQSKRLGFDGKTTFNPRQLELLNTVFSPDEGEIAYARRVVTAFESAQARGDASVAVGGQLVDLPIVRRAQRILEIVQNQANV